MASWCFNILTVSGRREDLLTFAEQARGVVDNTALALSLHALVPEPDFPEDSSDWLRWRRLMWGTKWDLDEVVFQDCGTYLRYEFATASQPPLNWIWYVGSEFEDLEFRLTYAEPGLVFAGRVVCQDGEAVTTYRTREVPGYNDLIREIFPGDESVLVRATDPPENEEVKRAD